MTFASPITLTTLLLLCCMTVSAQDCTVPPSAQIDLAANGVRARLTTGGDLWWDGQDARYEVTEDAGSPNVNPVAAIFAGGLWLGGKDPGGGLKVAAQRYDRTTNNFDYRPGPLNENGTTVPACENWDRFFVINQREVRSFLNDFDPQNPDVTVIPDQIAGWPATGNPLFQGIHGFALPNTPQGLAPFYDVDLDGLYNPLKGDYPLFCGDEAIWCVFNDAGIHEASNTVDLLHAEIQLMAYAYADNDVDLHRTTFYDYKIINRSQEDWLEFYAGHWIDSDLGCYTDDLINSAPDRNLFYVYNTNGTDQDPCPQGISSYGTSAPVNIFQVLSSNADREAGPETPLLHSLVNLYAGGIPGMSTPNTRQEYFNVLSGRWKDGQPMTRGGTGYESGGAETNYAFDGGEVNGAPWWHCNTPLPQSDIRQVYSTGPYTVSPGEIAEFTLGVTTIFGVEYPDGDCPANEPIFTAADKIKGIYDDNCSSAVLSSSAPLLRPEEVGLVTFPNPTSGQVTFSLPENRFIKQVQILDIAGRVVAAERSGNSPSVTMNLSLPAGTYLYRLTTGNEQVVIGRMVVLP